MVGFVVVATGSIRCPVFTEGVGIGKRVRPGRGPADEVPDDGADVGSAPVTSKPPCFADFVGTEGSTSLSASGSEIGLAGLTVTVRVVPLLLPVVGAGRGVLPALRSVGGLTGRDDGRSRSSGIDVATGSGRVGVVVVVGMGSPPNLGV